MTHFQDGGIWGLESPLDLFDAPKTPETLENTGKNEGAENFKNKVKQRFTTQNSATTMVAVTGDTLKEALKPSFEGFVPKPGSKQKNRMKWVKTKGGQDRGITSVRNKNTVDRFLNRFPKNSLPYLSRFSYYLTLLLFIVICVSIAVVSVMTISGMKVMYVTSGSMEPVYYKGDAVILAPVDNNLVNSYSVGNVVAIQPEWYNGNVVTHRIVEMNGGSVITQGDANQMRDPETPRNLVLGTVVAKIPKLGWILNIYAVVALSVITMFSYLVTYLSSTLWREKQKRTVVVG